jgi:ribosomal protein S11
VHASFNNTIITITDRRVTRSRKFRAVGLRARAVDPFAARWPRIGAAAGEHGAEPEVRIGGPDPGDLRSALGALGRSSRSPT